MVLDILAFFCLILALLVLITLSIIDLKTFLLPNRLVALFAALGITFHGTTGFSYTPPLDMALGALIAGSLLYGIRFGGNRIYNTDTLGLGDVKLMTAAGLWLGVDFVLVAITLGALAGFIHGIGLAAYLHLKTKAPVSLNRLNIPAGPGFAAGTVIAAALKFSGVPLP